MRTTGVNKKKLRKILSDCAFSPTEPGPFKVISDVGDPEYYLKRAREELSYTHQDADLVFAIRCLTLALAERQERRPLAGNTFTNEKSCQP